MNNRQKKEAPYATTNAKLSLHAVISGKDTPHAAQDRFENSNEV